MVDRKGDTRHGEETERRFIRHPAHVPIHVTSIRPPGESHVADVSHGGLAFTCIDPLSPGAEIEIRIPDVDASFRARARVAWCRPADGGHRVGVCFLDPEDAFRSRMVEQLCAIESYRREVLQREGRVLSGNEAAREWIERFGSGFPDP
mgnify:CR=1 FL=1